MYVTYSEFKHRIIINLIVCLEKANNNSMLLRIKIFENHLRTAQLIPVDDLWCVYGMIATIKCSVW